MPLILTALLLYLSCSPCVDALGIYDVAAKWYVDSVNGSDSNTGLSQAQAFKTIAKALQQTFAAGECLGLARGSVWREQITAPAANFCVSVYGTGAAPLLDASDIILTSAWSKTGGFTNIYQATVTTANALGWLRVWENNVSLTRAASQAALDSAVGYWPSADPLGNGTTSFTLYVHATGDGNPASNGNTYEYNNRSAGVFSQYAIATVSGIRTRRNLGNNGSFEVGGKAFVTDVEADDGTKHNALIHEGSYWNGIIVKDHYYGAQSANLLEWFEPTATGLDTTIINGTCSDAISPIANCFYAHTSNPGNTGNLYLTNFTTSSTGTPFSAFGVGYASFHVTNCSCSSTSSSGFGGGGPNFVSGSAFTASYRTVVLDGGGTPVSLTITGATTITSTATTDTTGADFTVWVKDSGSTLDIEDSSVVGASASPTSKMLHLIKFSGSGINFTSLRNSFTNGNTVYNSALTPMFGTLNSDNNTLTNVAFGVVYQNVVKTWAQWKTLTGQDSHSTP